MTECQSNQSSSHASPLLSGLSLSSHLINSSNNSLNNLHNTALAANNNSGYIYKYDHEDVIDFTNFNTSRLSKVTEETSNNNNSSKDQDEEEDQHSQYEQELQYEEYEQYAADHDNTSSLTLHALYQHHLRHNNTPHTNDVDEEQHVLFSALYTPPNELIPERIRLLLDRFAANGYLISNAPPPANKHLIDSIPEMLVDQKFIDKNSGHIDDSNVAEIECAICKTQIELQQKIKILPCKHYFHSICIITWLNIHASCPLCRRNLSANNSSSNLMSNASNTGITESMTTEDAQTRSQMNRLHDLRRRRRLRRTLRSYTGSGSASGSQTPHSLRGRRPTNNNNGNGSGNGSGNGNGNGGIQHAATQLIHAVCEILDQYSTQQQSLDIDQRTVRFRDETRYRQRKKLVTSPRPPPPRSSRTPTKTRNSLPHLADDASDSLTISTKGTHKKNHSSPSHKMQANTQQKPRKNTIDSILSSPKLPPFSPSHHERTESESYVNVAYDVEKAKEISNEPISATSIKRDLATWRKRRSKLDSKTKRCSVLSEEVDDCKYADNSASTSRRQSVQHSTHNINNNNGNGNGNSNGPTIIYNSNFNQNYIYNNNYNHRDSQLQFYDDEELLTSPLPNHGAKLNILSSTPSPTARKRPSKVLINTRESSGKLPGCTTQIGTEYSSQTMIERNSNFPMSPATPFSGPSSPILATTKPRKSLNAMVVVDDEEIVDDLLMNYTNTPTPAHSTPNNIDIYSLMSNEQLESAANRHKSRIAKHQYIVEQIQQEQNKRALSALWKCPECLKHQRAFIFLPCRHLGLCQKCNTQKLSKAMRCYTCNACIKQKIPINFATT